MKKEDEKQNRPLVVIDLGSSGIRCMAAVPDLDGCLRIVGVESETHYGCVEKGCVINSSDAGFLIKRCEDLLSNRIGSKEPLREVFVCMGGQLLQVVDVEGKRNLSNKSYIVPAILADIKREVVEKIELKYPTMKVIGCEPVSYVLDGEPQTYEPTKTQKAKFLQVFYHTYVVKRETAERLHKALDQSGSSIVFEWALPEVLTTAITSDEDRTRGCAIIDFGAQTTTCSLIADDECYLTKVVPLGGYHLTKDIQSQQLSFESAEKAKVLYGVAAEELVKKGLSLRMNSTIPGEKVTLSTSLLAMIIQSRLNEILDPIWAIIRQHEERIRKIYITGGGAMLQELVPYLQARTEVPVDFGSHADWLTEDTDAEYYQPQYATCVGLLALAADYRKQHPEETLTTSPIKRDGLFSRWRKRTEYAVYGLFTDPDTDDNTPNTQY